MQNIIVIGLGGFIGAIMRYLGSGWIYRITGSSLPWGTLFVNVAGSFVLGFFLVFESTRVAMPPVVRNFVAVGICGAFTTFSTFSYEAIQLLQNQLYIKAFIYVLLNVIICLAAAWGGMIAARMLP